MVLLHHQLDLESPGRHTSVMVLSRDDWLKEMAALKVGDPDTVRSQEKAVASPPFLLVGLVSRTAAATTILQ